MLLILFNTISAGVTDALNSGCVCIVTQSIHRSTVICISAPVIERVWDKKHCQVDGEVLVPHTAIAPSFQYICLQH